MYSRSLVSRHSTPGCAQGGFGLIELLVSVSIIVLVMGIVLARQDAFNGAILLRNQAYEVAFAIREAQLSAVSAQGDAGDFRRVVGVHFSEDAPEQYIIFNDGGAGFAPDGFHSTTEDTYVGGAPRFLDPRFEISDIRVFGDTFSTDGAALSVIFIRPNFDAQFYESDSPGGRLDASRVEVDVKRVGVAVDPTDPSTVRTIEITATGQVAVQ